MFTLRDNPGVEVGTFEELLTPRGERLIETATALLATDDELAVGSRLRRDQRPDLVAAAIAQVLLRRRAVTKFGADADRLWLTAEALEQASRRTVAAHRAERLRAAGVRTVVDLGCGIGADLLAYAGAGLDVTGVEVDPLRAAMAEANLTALGLSGRVEVADAQAFDTGGFDAVYADPARRDDRGRVFDPRRQTPSWDLVTELLAGVGVVKTAPGIPHRLVPDGVEAEFVSDTGDLVEAALWGRSFASTVRRATVLPAGASLSTDDVPVTVPIGGPAAWWYEPEPAVIRAHLVGAVADAVNGHLLDPQIAYVASDRQVATPFARAYRTLEEVPFREKRLRAALRERDIGTLTIKKRGVDVLPERLRPRLALRGDRAGTVILTRVAGAARAFLVEPV